MNEERYRLCHDLTMMLLYVMSWRERSDSSLHAWKGFDFAVVDALREEGFIVGSDRAKSTELRFDGVEEARRLLREYGHDGALAEMGEWGLELREREAKMRAALGE